MMCETLKIKKVWLKNVFSISTLSAQKCISKKSKQKNVSKIKQMGKTILYLFLHLFTDYH